jgi:hypothetical protein
MATTLQKPPSKGMVEIGVDGTLVYTQDDKGNRLPDFSCVGYHLGAKAIPDAEVVETLTPAEGDNTEVIQDAIDRIGNREPDENGLRGALLLKRGLYRVEGSLFIRHSGVVLRGEGQGKNGTVLVATGYGKPEHNRDFITVGNGNPVVLKEESRRAITDAYVPVGSDSFSVESAEGYKVGDCIILYRPSTAAWLASIGMDRIPAKFEMKNGKQVDITRQWQPGVFDFRFERRITAILGNRITIDVPLVHALEAQYGGGTIYHYDTPGRVFEAGIEDLSLMSEFGDPIPGNPCGNPSQELTAKFQEPQNENHAWNAVNISRNSENVWVRRVTAGYFGMSLARIAGSKATVEDCVNLGHISTITGGRRYTFDIHGQMNLVQRCVTRRARHEYVTGRSVPGPNAFVDCLGVACVALHGCGPHHRYAAGILFDNIKSESAMESEDYGNRGSGHGWGGAQICFYNCVAPEFWVKAPPGSACWVIGNRKPGAPESRMARPRSLYLAQLEDRLGREAVENVTTGAQRNGTIHDLLMKRLEEHEA